MTIRYPAPDYACDMCAAEETARDGPEGWLFIQPAFARRALHVCVACQDRPMRELRMLMEAAS